jgi:hypothetical protein
MKGLYRLHCLHALLRESLSTSGLRTRTSPTGACMHACVQATQLFLPALPPLPSLEQVQPGRWPPAARARLALLAQPLANPLRCVQGGVSLGGGVGGVSLGGVGGWGGGR